jgi:uncharacterized protein with HEPN domain
MWRDDALLVDMLAAARQARDYATAVSLDDFCSQHMTQDAVIRQLLVLGEAARAVSEQRKGEIPQMDWSGLIGLRNVLVHQYSRLDIHRIWEIATKEIPPIIAALKPLIPPEAPP